jgi:hypothetical protein
MAPEEPPWVWGGYIARGMVTAFAGRPKVGKSTLALAVVDAIASGASEFLGRAVAAGPVVYLSEEGAGTLRHKLPAGPVRIAPRESAWPEPGAVKPKWPQVVAGAAAEAERTGAGLLVIDTFAFWGALPEEKAQDAGAVSAAMEPLQAVVAGSGPAVLLILHQRKGGGADGEAVLGATAFTGGPDIVIELERPKGESAPRERALLALSRYPGTPGALLLDYDPAKGAWRALGEEEDRTQVRSLRDSSALLRATAAAGDEGATRVELEEALGAPQRQWRAPLAELEKEGCVERLGGGKKGDPNRWRFLRTNAAHGPAQKRAETAAAGGSNAAACSDRSSSISNPPQPDSAQPPGCAETQLTLADDEEFERIRGLAAEARGGPTSE